ncbi:unnamed protein product, partial [Adineta ricciae]
MAKFESPAVVRRKLQVDFGEDTPTEACIKRTFERFCETDCSVSRGTAHRIMRDYLGLKPYKAQFVQQLYEEDTQDRVDMCKTLIPMLQDKINKHNVRYWSEDNPHATIETVMNSPKLNVWCAMSRTHLIGPFFFEGDTVNGEKYLSMLQNFFLPEQDGAPPHFAVDVRQYLDHQFPQRWIGRGGPIRWAPRSPDLTPLDFFLWGHLKNIVYKTP